MVTFEVPDMTCGHCVSSITRAVHALDPDAKLTADLATHRVQIEPGASDKAGLLSAVREAGFTPGPVEDATSPTERSVARSGCCCR